MHAKIRAILGFDAMGLMPTETLTKHQPASKINTAKPAI